MVELWLGWGFDNIQGKLSFKNRDVKSYNQVQAEIFKGGVLTVKYKLKNWVKQNVSISVVSLNSRFLRLSTFPLTIQRSLYCRNKSLIINLYLGKMSKTSRGGVPRF